MSKGLKQKLLIEQVDLLYKQSTSSMYILTATNLVVSYLIRNDAHYNIWIWFVASTIFNMLRLIYILKYFKDSDKENNIKKWHDYYKWGCFIIGLFNALLLFVFTPDKPFYINLMFAVTGGLIAASTVIYAPIKLFYYLYFVPTFSGLLFIQITGDATTEENIFKGLMILFFGAVMLITVKRINEIYTKSLLLRFEKNNLIDELKISNEIALRQKELVENKNLQILDSINYARRIQSAILPTNDYLASAGFKYFILFKPKDIVSGDFYWAYKNKVDNTLLISAIDCTGHGVPGAFMSIVAHGLFEKIIKQLNITSPDQIISKLGQGIFNILARGRKEDIKDGMDLVFCEIDLETKTLRSAGAYNDLCIVRDNKAIIFKGDKYAVGNPKHFKEKYTLNEFQLQKNDTLYLYTDGYQDQKGGPRQKKYMTKFFREKLAEIGHLPPEEQREILKTEHLNWKGENEQLDDICVIGIKI